MSLQRKPTDYPCSECGARRGEKCRDRHQRERKAHEARRELSRRANREQAAPRLTR